MGCGDILDHGDLKTTLKNLQNKTEFEDNAMFGKATCLKLEEKSPMTMMFATVPLKNRSSKSNLVHKKKLSDVKKLIPVISSSHKRIIYIITNLKKNIIMKIIMRLTTQKQFNIECTRTPTNCFVLFVLAGIFYHCFDVE